ncbi:DUF86 domain-containing protein [Marinobacterium sp. D7]|uniref:HepT-like ribonuclease domain-containing protein n=1 Tax=Marinobacterium ramblicola TaxID=2849041 RepID=UPI001C2DB500|nr:HepT-like ribonuclease domain-containing protein [Marinobacterium ramblicola]MBV1789397.1 DUF86 domain-containing protein [Marinobacterium ramblicola]
MSRDKQRIADYLTHILEAIERIDRYTEEMSEVTFLENEMAQDAVIRNFEIIGEASNNIEKHYPEFAAEHPELPLAFAYQMRNAYFKVDLEIVWKTIHRDLPGLYQQVQQVLEGLPPLYHNRADKPD